VEWPLKYPALFANGEQAEERMRQEITADADRLMNGEDSELTKRIRSIQGAELSDGWARMVSDARRDGIKRG
ncbi:MAG: hypothetical protein MRY32_06360, partial [Rickettsiales bacterium]|nr:hypothetical protein [Rickettsiales bacterium]